MSKKKLAVLGDHEVVVVPVAEPQDVRADAVPAPSLRSELSNDMP